MSTSTEISRMFYAEIRSKKRAGRGVHSQKGKRGYVGKVMTTSDYLKGRELRRYKGTGLVKKMNVYDEIIPINKLLSYAPATRKKIMIAWKDKFKPKEIVAGLGVSRDTYYNLCYDLGLEKPESRKGMRSQVAKNTEITDGEILTFGELKELPNEEQFKLLENWLDKYPAKAVATYWGKTTSSVYSKRYYLKNWMEKNGLMNEYIDKKNSEKPVMISHSVQDTEVPEDKLEQVEAEEKATNEDETLKSKSLLEVVEELSQKDKEAEEHEKDRKVTEFVKQEEEKKQQEETLEEVKEELSTHIRTLSKQVEHLESEKEELESSLAEAEKSNKWLLDSVKKDSLEMIKRDSHEVINLVEEESQGMAFNLKDEKEGTHLYKDVKRFLNIIKNNPDTFKIEMRVKRIDE